MASSQEFSGDEDEWSDEGNVLETAYGDKIDQHLTSRQLTAEQVRALQPLVDGYIGLKGKERTAYVQKAFETVWDGDAIDWTKPTTWPSRAANPRFTYLKMVCELLFDWFEIMAMAIRNFFKERGRVRDVIVRLPGKGRSRLDWTVLGVCGEVYKGVISDLVEEVSGLKPGAKKGWLTEYKRARAAVYYSLTEEERTEVQVLCKQWNRTGIPLSIKKKQYDRNCRRLLRDVAMACLKRYGVYVYFLVVAEPGVDVQTDIIDFSTDLGLGDQLFEDTTVIQSTLARLQSFVHTHAGAGEVRTEGKKQKESKLSKPTAYNPSSEQFRNRNSLAIEEKYFDMANVAKDSRNVLYSIFRYAHANISPRRPGDIEPPWKAISEGRCVDARFFPPGFKPGDVTMAREAQRMELFYHLLKIGYLEFHEYKIRNSDPQPPVPFDRRWWAVQPGQAGFDEFEAAKAKALAARPTYFGNDTVPPPPLNNLDQGTASLAQSGLSREGSADSGPQPGSAELSMSHQLSSNSVQQPGMSS
ncbi:unnamed protein product [Peniophora sp. CBMAI 1063]|nr:unnamed protein product [Peniophora sp. CBMAI 1063]